MMGLKKLKIDVLYPGNKQELLDELTFEQMNEIRGGLTEPNLDNINPQPTSDLLKNLDGYTGKLVTEIDDKVQGMRQLFAN